MGAVQNERLAGEDDAQARPTVLQTIGQKLRALPRITLDALYPPVCLACDGPVASPDTICPTCFAGLVPITQPCCPVLGLPFAVSLGPDARSAEALADPPPFDRARSAVLYGEVARTLVSKLKYGDRPDYARFCAQRMADAGHEFWSGDPVIVPVPLHYRRHLTRRYNQSGELALALSRLTGARFAPDLVTRTRPTRQQVGLSHDARTRNVSGAFTAHPDLLGRLGGRPIVLVDDVYTTGATLKAVTKALRRGGASRIDVLTFARVVTGGEMTI